MDPSRENLTANGLEGGGEMGELIRSRDWRDSSLGPISEWPQCLRNTLNLTLNTPFPIAVFWGAEFITFYNDAFRLLIGKKHPQALGKMAANCWSEIWEEYGPMINRVYHQGQSESLQQQQVSLIRHGFLEEAYFTTSHSPIRNDCGGIVGVLNIVCETTTQTIWERRAKVITELSNESLTVENETEAFKIITQCFDKNRWDIPFSLIFLINEKKDKAILRESSGIILDNSDIPATINLSDSTDSDWPLNKVIQEGQPFLLKNLEGRIRILPGIPWPEPPTSSLAFPIKGLAQTETIGILVFGISPRLKLDDSYKSFFQLIVERIGHLFASISALSKTEQQISWLKSLFLQAPAAISILSGPNLEYVFVNPLFYELAGRHNLLGRTAREVFPELESQGIFEILDKAYQGEAFTTQEMLVSLDRGQGPKPAYFRFTYQPMRNAQGKIEGVMALAFEITTQVLARKKAEAIGAELKAQRTVLEKIARRTPLSKVLVSVTRNAEILIQGSCASILLLSPDGRHLVNGASFCMPDNYLQAIEGHAIEARQGICATVALTGARIYVEDASTHPEWKSKDDPGLENGFTACLCLPISTASGKTLAAFALYFKEPRHLDRKEISRFETLVGIAGIAIEQHAAEIFLRQVQDQLLQAQKMESIGKLAGGIAHDFNNLLTAINGYSHLSLSLVEKDNPLYGHLTEIKKAGERAADLTRQLLAYSRKQILSLKIVDLNALIINFAKMLKRIIGENIELELKLDSTLKTVNVDPVNIEQVLMNLVVNARDAIPSSGKIRIQTLPVEVTAHSNGNLHALNAGSYTLLTVTDNGTGMSEEVKSLVFEPFFTTKEFGRGSGLGLATVYGIISQSGGHIFIDSREGQGTSFSIYFPVAEEGIGVNASIPASSFSNPKALLATILLVEDEESVRELVKRILEQNGYAVLEARDGQEGLEMGRSHPGKINLIISDVVMPRMDGIQMVKQLRSLKRDVCVLFMSGYTDTPLARNTPQRGNTHFISKPFMPNQLLDEVRELLGVSARGEASA